MATKVKKAQDGPGWLGIVFGVTFRVALGAALAFLYLVFKPVQVVKELPKQAGSFTVYYVEGTKNADQSHQWLQKKKLFDEGGFGTLTLNEDELNAWIAGDVQAAKSATDTPASARLIQGWWKLGKNRPKPAAAGGAPGAKGAKGAAVAAAPSQPTSDGPNFRIRDGALQIGMPCSIDAPGVSTTIVVQARGGFVKKGDRFVFVPSEFYLGSCPLHRLPGLAGYMLDKIMAMQAVPEDVTAAWKKLSDIKVEGSTLKLTMP